MRNRHGYSAVMETKTNTGSERILRRLNELKKSRSLIIKQQFQYRRSAETMNIDECPFKPRNEHIIIITTEDGQRVAIRRKRINN